MERLLRSAMSERDDGERSGPELPWRFDFGVGDFVLTLDCRLTEDTEWQLLPLSNETAGVPVGPGDMVKLHFPPMLPLLDLDSLHRGGGSGQGASQDRLRREPHDGPAPKA
jgi:hypothetical protein